MCIGFVVLEFAYKTRNLKLVATMFLKCSHFIISFWEMTDHYDIVNRQFGGVHVFSGNFLNLYGLGYMITFIILFAFNANYFLVEVVSSIFWK